MQETEITAGFGPAAQDRKTLSKSSASTLDQLYRHPVSHNLEWSDVIKLFEKVGTVNHKANDDVVFGISGEHHVVRKPHNKDLTTSEVMQFRQMLSRAGWAPVVPAKPRAKEEDAVPDGSPEAPTPPDIMAVVDHHEAWIYHLDSETADDAYGEIKPNDAHHFLHHLSHKDQPRERGQRSPEDHQFYEQIAQSLASAGRIILVGHGKGHSNAAHLLAEFLRQHHAQTALKVVDEIVADLSSLTPPQLIALGRSALTV